MNALNLVLLVARREYLRTVRRRGYLVATLLIPLGAAGIFFIAQLFSAPSGPSLDPTVYLVDESGLALQADPQSPKIALVDRPTGQELLESGSADELYVLPRTYTTTGVVERVIRTSAAAESFEVQALTRHTIEEQRLTTYLRRALIGDRLPPEERERIVAPVTVRDVLAGGQPAPPPDIAHFLLPYAFALLFLLSLFITSGYLLQSVTEERETRAVEIVVSSVPTGPLMAGKVLGLGGAGLTQVAVWVASALALPRYASVAIPGLSQISAPVAVLVLAVLFFILGYALYSGIYAAIGALAPGTREAQQYAGFLALFAVLPLIATSAFLNDPRQPIVIAMALFPFTAPAAMLQILALEDTIPWALVAASLGILAVSAVVVTLASARVFRATVLLYGKRPSIASIVSAVFAR
jgi:ABC-2 type transport system permease protein